MAYFSGMSRNDWPEAVDARPTTQPEEGAVSTSSESGGAGAGRKESPTDVGESLEEKGGAR